jgi:TonB family protein
MATLQRLFAVLGLATGAVACQRSGTPPPPSHSLTPTTRVVARSPVGVAQAAVAVPLTPAPIYRVGGDVLAPIEITHVQPRYPEVCRAHAVQGTPILEAVIDVHGAVTSVRVLRPPQAQPLCPELEAACAKALLRWRYRPATLHGTPVAVHLTVTFSIHPK